MQLKYYLELETRRIGTHNSNSLQIESKQVKDFVMEGASDVKSWFIFNCSSDIKRFRRKLVKKN